MSVSSIANVIGIDDTCFSVMSGASKLMIVEHLLHDGVQAARADVLGPFIHLEGEVRHFLERFRSELQLQSFSIEQRRVLLGQRRLRLGENLDEVFDRQRLQFDADRKAALQLRNEIARL